MRTNKLWISRCTGCTGCGCELSPVTGPYKVKKLMVQMLHCKLPQRGEGWRGAAKEEEA